MVGANKRGNEGYTSGLGCFKKVRSLMKGGRVGTEPDHKLRGS